MDKSAILEGCSLFSGVTDSHRRRLVDMAKKLTFRTGTLIFRQGDACPGIFCVGNGNVRIYRMGAAGKEHTLHMAGPGQTFAEVAVIGGFPCPAFAEAVASSECALLPTQDLMSMLKQEHAFCLELLVGMSRWVRHLTGLLEDITLRDATGRVARHLLLARPDAAGTIGLAGLKKHVASQLNLTSETFSRVLRKLADGPILAIIDDKRLRILDRRALEDMAE